jgi:uncharacterized protein (DUF1800 family)
MASETRKINHLLWRAGFGGGTGNFNKVTAQKTAEQLFDDSKSWKEFSVMSKPEDFKKKLADKDARKQFKIEQRDQIKQLNIAWFKNMLPDENALREKMSLFWHGHFACRALGAWVDQSYINTIRKNSLGKFGDLLLAVSKEPSMLQFLNVLQDKKGSPNENFAREVMELFTMGRGNYTENDIKEAARAYTGWSINPQTLEFMFRPFIHDNGEKTFLGQTGNFDGDAVLKIILSKPATAQFITKKIYKYFVNENVDDEIVYDLADQFYKSDYDINLLMRTIFTSDWFYDDKNMGVKIKSPVELLAGLTRTFNIDYQNDDAILFVQKILDQILFYPPNVAGWPGGKNWIDSSSLLFRMRLPEYVFLSSEINEKVKDPVATEMMGMESYEPVINQLKRMNANIEWDNFLNQFKNIPKEQIYNLVCESLLQMDVNSVSQSEIEQFVSKGDADSYLKTLSIHLTMLPEYQLC